MYKKLLQKGIDALEREKSNNIKKHILDILNNIGTIFTGAYMHCRDVLKETIFERTIVERLKLRKEKIAQIEKEEKSNLLFKEYFTNYQWPSDMYKKLCKTEGARNENRVYLIKEVLNKMKKIIENVPENKTWLKKTKR